MLAGLSDGFEHQFSVHREGLKREKLIGEAKHADSGRVGEVVEKGLSGNDFFGSRCEGTSTYIDQKGKPQVTTLTRLVPGLLKQIDLDWDSVLFNDQILQGQRILEPSSHVGDCEPKGDQVDVDAKGL